MGGVCATICGGAICAFGVEGDCDAAARGARARTAKKSEAETRMVRSF